MLSSCSDVALLWVKSPVVAKQTARQIRVLYCKCWKVLEATYSSRRGTSPRHQFKSARPQYNTAVLKWLCGEHLDFSHRLNKCTDEQAEVAAWLLALSPPKINEAHGSSDRGAAWIETSPPVWIDQDKASLHLVISCTRASAVFPLFFPGRFWTLTL